MQVAVGEVKEMKFKEYQDLAKDIKLLYQEMDQVNDAFLSKNNISCSTSCGGVCCKSNTVEVSPIDLIPLAVLIIETNKYEDILPKLYLHKNDHCFFWIDGKCSEYENRAVLCRLFGVSSVFNKNHELTLSICSFIKNDGVNHVNLNQADAPNIVNYSSKINALAPNWPGYTMPFNQALIYAIERILNTFMWES